jgi:hypothetical protein
MRAIVIDMSKFIPPAIRIRYGELSTTNSVGSNNCGEQPDEAHGYRTLGILGGFQFLFTSRAG